MARGSSSEPSRSDTRGQRKKHLTKAKNAKNDEFYTQWIDIEREINAYIEHDPDVFRGKTILLPCDDPEWSNFTKFFALHFSEYGIKKIVSTSFAPNSKRFNVETVFSGEAKEDWFNGKIFTMDASDINEYGFVDVDNLRWEYLKGDGDFRSEEVTTLRDAADIVITNPPFSLFREFVAWLMKGNVKFSILGSINAVTYRDFFPLIKDGRVWKGATGSNTTKEFRTDDGTITTIPGTSWYTNIEHSRRREKLDLMTMKDNRRYSKHAIIKELGYQKFDNYDAINVPFTTAIPRDYDGIMGVPITFLDKYNPEQFEILGITTSWDKAYSTRTYPVQTQIKNTKSALVAKLNDGPAIKITTPPKNRTYYKVGDELFTAEYARVLIRFRNNPS